MALKIWGQLLEKPIMVRELELIALPPTSRKKRGSWELSNHQWPIIWSIILTYWNIHESLNKRVQRTSRMVNASHAGKMVLTKLSGDTTQRGHKILCSLPFWSLPYVPLHLAVRDFFAPNQ